MTCDYIVGSRQVCRVLMYPSFHKNMAAMGRMQRRLDRTKNRHVSGWQLVACIDQGNKCMHADWSRMCYGISSITCERLAIPYLQVVSIFMACRNVYTTYGRLVPSTIHVNINGENSTIRGPIHLAVN